MTKSQIALQKRQKNGAFASQAISLKQQKWTMQIRFRWDLSTGTHIKISLGTTEMLWAKMTADKSSMIPKSIDVVTDFSI